LGLKIILAVDPMLARGLHIGALLLAGMNSLFLCVWPCRSRNFQTAVLTIVTQRSSRKSLDHLVQRRVKCLRNGAKNEIRMRIKHGTLRLALFGGAEVARCSL
jgi:hypothetical protein